MYCVQGLPPIPERQAQPPWLLHLPSGAGATELVHVCMCAARWDVVALKPKSIRFGCAKVSLESES